MLTGALIGLYVVCFAACNLCFKLAVIRSGGVATAYFIAGNVLGFGCTLLITFALKRANPNVVYAVCVGGGFVLLQLASLAVFRQPLSGLQWLGVGLVGTGVLLLQLKA
ncbi:MAG: hypothetical protein JO317_05730 [Verrucomicrobiae bacterium]|nr:hypothetical protein [Verrucomicrobiae bacterium]